jgi:hypothetical protein
VAALLEYEKARVVALERAIAAGEGVDGEWLKREIDASVRNAIEILSSCNFRPTVDPSDKRRWLVQFRAMIRVFDSLIQLASGVSDLCRKTGVSVETLQDLARDIGELERMRERLLREGAAVRAVWPDYRIEVRHLVLTILFFVAGQIVYSWSSAVDWPAGQGFAALLWLGSFGFLTLIVRRMGRVGGSLARGLDLVRRYVANEDPPPAA